MTAVANDFAGVWGGSDPAAALRSLGVAPVWHDTRVAFGGAPFWEDPTSGVVVSGVLVPDGDLPALLGQVGFPTDAPPLALAATLFARHGIEAGRRLPGMFALAFWEPRLDRLTLLRDPVGARTLYWTSDASGSAAWFAARLRTLRRAAPLCGRLSLPALRDYLTCAFVPGERTLWEGALELRPGSALHLPGFRRTAYWNPREGSETRDASLEEYAARLRPELDAAVRRRLPAATDPVGIYLSGGLDSSLVTAIAAREREAQGASPVQTYAIHFGSDLPNELVFSDQVARHCGTRHRVLELPAKRILEHLAQTIAALDDPIGDPLTVPNLLLGLTARQEVGVILNGEGGDPCFGGPKNAPMLLHELYEGDDESGRIDAYFRSYQKCYDDLPRLLTGDALGALADVPPQRAVLDPYLGETAPMRQYLNRLMQINIDLKGADHILTKVSNLTSACGLVGQSPLFDVAVTEAAYAIPAPYKRAGSEEKAVLKAAVADLLPSSILTRPKSGMLVPVQRWFQKDMRRYAADLLLSRQARIRPYLRQDIIREWLSYKSPAPFARQGVKLWLVLTLEVWLRENER